MTATGGTPTFTQGGSSGVDLYSAINAATNDSGQTFSGAALTVNNVSDATEYLTVGSTDIALTNGASGTFTGGNYSVSVSGTTATVTLSGMTLTNEAMETLIDGITYRNSAASVTAGNRVIKLASVTDSGGSNNSAVLSITATVTVVKFPATAANSTVSASEATVLADGSAASTITVTLKDANSNPVSGKSVTLAQGSGSSTITTVSGTTNAGGEATFTVKSTKAEAVTYTATDTTDNVTVTPTATVTFTAGTPTAAKSTVAASPTSVEANGTAASTITVTLKDANSNPVGGKAVTLTAGSGSSTITTVSGTTDASGQATFTVKDTVLETVTYTATDTTDTVTVTQTASVTFIPGAPTAANSTVSASEATVLADGSAASTITVTLKDANSNPVSGKTVTLAQGSGSSTITTVSGTTNAGGEATFTVKNTKAEAVTYTATDTTDNVTVTPTATVTFTAGTPTAAKSSVAASPTSVEANGTAASTITVTLKDANSNPVGGKTVTLAAGSGSSTITTVSGTTDASGQATFTVKDTVLETVTYTATDTTDTVTVTQTASVTFIPGAPTAANSTVSASKATVLADGSAISTITVTLKDTNSNPVSGKTVTLAQGSGSSTITTVSGTTNAGGEATFTVKNTKAEAVTYTATDTTDNVTVTPTTTVTFTAGTPTAAKSSVAASPTSVEANGTAASTITVTLKDANSNPVGGKTVTLTAGSGSSTITTVSGTTDASGQATFTVKDTVLETVTYTATDTTDTVKVTQTASVTFIPGAPTAENSTVSASEATVLADGSAASTITVTLKDTNSNPVSGKTVTLVQGSGSSTITTVSGTTNAGGEATFTVKNTKAEAVTYTATDTTDNVTVTPTATVTFTAGTPTAAKSSVAASPTSVEANGTAASTITVTLKDANSNPVGGKTVTLVAGSGSSTITTVSGTTDASGQATFTVKDTVLETVTYTATDTTDTVTVTQTASVTFIPGAPTAENSTVSASKATVLADGSAISTITVTLKDTNSNPVSGKTVTLAQGSGSSTITTVSGTTNASGEATFTVKSSKAEAVTYTATDTTDNVTVTPTATVTFTVPTYTATINTKIDGTETDMNSVVLENGSSTVAAAKTSTGVYTATVVNGTYSIYTNGIYTGVDITVNYATASTDVNYYTVSFDTQGGNAVASQTVLSGSKAAIPAVPAKSGNTFAGWYTDTSYGTAWNFSTRTITAAKTFYAKWTPVLTYTVAYSGNGSTSGSAPTDSNAYVSGATVTVKGNTGSLAKTGNALTGWSNGTTIYTTGQTFAITGDVTLTAVWTSVASTYTVTYSNNYTGGGTYTTQNGISSGSTLTAPSEPARSGYTFIGWYKDFSCVNPWNFSVDTVTGNTTLYARWSENTYSVDGTVKDDTTPTTNAVSGATIKVMQGNALFGKTVTASDGTFTVTGIPNGIYNLVITKGSQEVTVCITVTGINFAAGTVTLPSGNKNSKLEVNGSGTPNVVVDNLTGVFGDSGVYTPANDNDVRNNGATVEIKLTVQKNDRSTNKTTVEATMTSGGYATGMVLDVDMTKTVTSNSGALTDESPVTAVSSLITLIIPLPTELQGKDSYVVTRAHDYNDGKGIVVDTISTSNDAAKERIVVSSDKTQLTLYVKYFSTYAIGYTTTSGGGSGGNSGASYTITATSGTGGSVSPSSASVVKGGSKSFTITAGEGYYISDVLVDGESVGSVSSYTFSNVSSAHTIEAVFSVITALPYYLNNDGNKVFIGFAAETGGKMKFIAPDGVTVLFKENTKSFTDTENHWAKSDISFVAEREIFVGTGGNRFSPDTGMTRAMFATVIGRLYERSYGEIEPLSAHAFTDCNYEDYYGKYVDWAAKNGILGGYGNGEFGPNDKITREQMVAILYRFADFLRILPSDMDTVLNYPDSGNISSWAESAALYCQTTGIITGRDGGNFVPQGTATRAEVAVILERFIENTLK